MKRTAGKTKIVWATGPVGGSWHQINKGIADLINEESSRINVELLPAGGKQNPTLVQDGAAFVGTTIDFVAAAAASGKDPFQYPHERLASLGSGWAPLPFHYVASSGREGSLRTVLASRGACIAIPPQGTFDETTFQRMMMFFGTSYEDIVRSGIGIIHGNYAEIAIEFVGKVDFIIGATSAPAASITALFKRPGGAKILSLDADLLAHLQLEYGMGSGLIPANTYPNMASPVQTALMDTIFVIAIDAPDDLVDELTSLLIAHREKLAGVHPSLRAFEPSLAPSRSPLPLHPAAANAYRRLGFAT